MELRDYLAEKYTPLGAGLAMHNLEQRVGRKGYDIIEAQYADYMPEAPFTITLRAKDGLVKSPDIDSRHRVYNDPERGVYTHRATMAELRDFCDTLPEAVADPKVSAGLRRLYEALLDGGHDRTAPTPAVSAEHWAAAEAEIAPLDEPGEEPEIVAQAALCDLIGICRAMRQLFAAAVRVEHFAGMTTDLYARLATLRCALDDLLTEEDED